MLAAISQIVKSQSDVNFTRLRAKSNEELPEQQFVFLAEYPTAGLFFPARFRMYYNGEENVFQSTITTREGATFDIAGMWLIQAPSTESRDPQEYIEGDYYTGSIYDPTVSISTRIICGGATKQVLQQYAERAGLTITFDN